MTNREGIITSDNIVLFDVITNLDTENFTLQKNAPFYLKNEGDEEVTLDVIPAAQKGDNWVSCKFQLGWNLEMIRAIKINATDKKLIWGY